MMIRTTLLTISCGLLLSGVCLAQENKPGPAQPGGGVSGVSTVSVADYTKPSKDYTLSFAQPGLVAQVLVKAGDPVQSGQVLVKLDDSAEREALAQQKAEANNNIRVEAAQEQLAQKINDNEKMQAAFKKGAASKYEAEHARLDAEIARLSLALAKFEKAQNVLKYKQTQAQVARMQIKSPFAGRVEEIFIHPGESADAAAKVIRVVKLDPLWVDTHVPLAQAVRLRVGDEAKVRLMDGKTELAGQIIFIGAVAGSTGELPVRVELANPTDRPAGEPVVVVFTEHKQAESGLAQKPVGPAKAVQPAKDHNQNASKE